MAKLYIIATPIGNLEDITYRAVRILSELQVLACEDTRHTKNLLVHYGVSIPKTMFSYNNFNEHSICRRIIGILESGQDVGICSNAGMPTISDPGYRIVRMATESGIECDVLPGACAIPTAIALSGLPTSSFTFQGFGPKKEGQRRNFLTVDKDSEHTQIFYESPLRFVQFLNDALTVYGNREACICFELTKMYQRIERGTLRQLHEKFRDEKNIKGEITIVIVGNKEKFIHHDNEENEASAC